MPMILCISCTYVKIFIDYMGFILKKNAIYLNQQSHENETILFAQPSGHERLSLMIESY